MFSDRDMFCDALDSVKHEIVSLTKAAAEASDEKIRQTFVQERNKAEQTQMELASIGITKGWYIPSPPAPDNDVQEVKAQYENAMNQMNSQSPVLPRV